MLSRQLQQVHCCPDIDVLIQQRVVQRRPYTGACGQMNDFLDWTVFEQPLHNLEVADISFDETITAAFKVGSDILSFDGWTIEVIEIIHTKDIFPAIK